MRISVSSRLFLAASAVFLLVSAAPVQAQQFDYYNTNSEIGTIGDLPDNKIKSPANKIYRLNFGAAPLFGGSDVFDIPSYKPFIYPLPHFSSTHDYTGVSYEEYLEQVAKSYGHSVESYLNEFTFQNEYSMANGVPLYEGYQDLSQVSAYLNLGGLQLVNAYFPDYASDNVSELLKKLSDEALKRIHQNDFRAGGGFIPLDGEPQTPNQPQEEDEFEELDPIFTTPSSPSDGTAPPGDGNGPVAASSTATLAGISQLADELAQDGAVNELGLSTLSGSLVTADETSSAAARVAVVPEPATLGLLSFGAGMMFARRRR